MMWRANDVLVGLVTGVVVAVVAALLESWFVALRFMSFGQNGGVAGTGLGIIAITGAVLGALIGLFLGGFIKPKTPSR